jgi:hypothetical protein
MCKQSMRQQLPEQKHPTPHEQRHYRRDLLLPPRPVDHWTMLRPLTRLSCNSEATLILFAAAVVQVLVFFAVFPLSSSATIQYKCTSTSTSTLPSQTAIKNSVFIRFLRDFHVDSGFAIQIAQNDGGIKGFKSMCLIKF